MKFIATIFHYWTNFRYVDRDLKNTYNSDMMLWAAFSSQRLRLKKLVDVKYSRNYAKLYEIAHSFSCLIIIYMKLILPGVDSW